MEIKLGRFLGKTAAQLAMIEVAVAQADPGYTVVVARYASNITIIKELDGIHATTTTGISLKAGGVKDALLKIAQIEDARHILGEKGRVYDLKDGKRTIHVWSKDVVELSTLKKVFGGNYYRHGSGFVWVVSKKSVLRQIDRETTLEVFSVRSQLE